MKPAPFDYMRPRDTSEAIAALAQGGGEAKLIAGGQSLGPMLNLRLARPKLLIDISGLEALRTMDEESEAWRLGAAVTHARIEDRRHDFRGCPLLPTVARDIAFRSVRNRGTVGGSMAHADPAADWPLALAALGATLLLQGPGGDREIPADDFMAAAFTTALRDDEMIAAVRVPKFSPSARFGYFKFCRKVGEFPEASGAAVFDPETRIARVFVGALSGAPASLPGLARDVAERGSPAVTAEAVLAAVTAAAPTLSIIEQRMHAETVRRALRQILPT
jgi:carbon-monoxide dehydrogenase medium subunit